MPSLDPEYRSDYKRLSSSVEWSVKEMASRRQQRLALLKKMVGAHFGEDGSKQRRPVNMIELGVDIFQRGLASHQPQAIVQTDYEELAPTAADFEIVLNRRIKRMKLQAALNTCAVEALFTMGVMCVGIGIEGEHDAGSVFAEPVLFPDLILDMNAKSWEQQGYVGHDFLVPLEWVKDSPLFDGESKQKFIRACEKRLHNSDEDWDRKRREDFQEMVSLRQLYLPRLHRVVICDPEGGSSSILASNEWEGPHGGPYHQLAFRTVPGHLFPLAPVPMWNDLDDIINRSFAKAVRQSLRSKTIAVTQNADDAATIRDTDDGEIANVMNPEGVKEITYGGADRRLTDMANIAKQLLVYTQGNWDALAGLGPMSGTVGQDQLMAQGASGRMKDMQQSVIEFQTGVINDVAFWLWQDPLGEERFTKKLEGTQYGVPGVWSPETRNGDFFQFNFTVNPYSLVNRSPTEQAQALTQVLEQHLIPALPHMQQGSPVDWEAYFKLLARYMHLPELNQIIDWPNGESQPQSSPETPKMPANTTRKYVRENRSGQSVDGLDAAFSAMQQTQGAPAGQPAA